jgi:hypothetical protein
MGIAIAGGSVYPNNVILQKNKLSANRILSFLKFKLSAILTTSLFESVRNKPDE